MADETAWIPPTLTMEDLASFEALRPGVPRHIRRVVEEWVYDHLPKLTKNYTEHAKIAKLIDFQTARRELINVPATESLPFEHVVRIVQALQGDHLVDLVDHMLSRDKVVQEPTDYAERVAQTQRQALESVLHRGASLWAVGTRGGRYGLVQRLPSASIESVEHVANSAQRANLALTRAWNAAFGPHPNTAHAYDQAITAVEEYAIPLVCPANNRATLQRVIKDLESQEGKWKFVLAGTNEGSGVNQVIGMMELLWKSQSKRHGGAEEPEITVEEAQAAVLLASTLVGWLYKGFLVRK